MKGIFNTFNQTTSYTLQKKKKMSSIKYEKYEMAGAIRYINFSGDYDKFYEWKENTKSIARHMNILKYLIK